MKKHYSTTLLFILLGLGIAHSQSGGLDASFDPGIGANAAINAVTIQDDGKIIIGGDFTNFNSQAKNRFIRLNADGSLDDTFVTGNGITSTISFFPTVRAMAIDSNGKIIVVGDFNRYNNVQRNNILRLNDDGTLDTTIFNASNLGSNTPILALAIQSDGKIIVAGGFTSFNNTPVNRIVRLNTDGTIDSSFNIGSGVNNPIHTVSIQADDKIILGGDFTNFNGTLVNRLVRLNTDGTLDSSFNIGSGANNSIRSSKIQSDGKILLGGLFTTFNTADRKYLARLNTDGTVDSTFDIQLGANNLVGSIAIQFNDKIVIGGNYSLFNSVTMNRIARLNNDGLIDTSFNSGTAANNNVNAIAIQEDGNIIIAGSFTTYNGTTRNRIARIFGDEPLNSSDFTKNPFFIYPNPSNDKITLQANGNVIESIKIYDTTGKLIFHKSNPDNYTFDVANFDQGIYFFTIENELGTFTQKFMKN
ncbi:T9SS type A sorting domain-containing protein [Flavobacterium cucumis]|uniref:Delta-60 repeat domain-containing protein/Por secretion system C-terminal sorting domain-containing protein n=1 Tax=Flavobacterium cucumis TaxID=416016 RepID=A0A1M7ZVV4_9FLAO|nr:T9SS type A sorting domain-containing protein [Flavobacterium cucumis]SHO73012.1 delta-60 repeat domain-containing protein/Por secretion system C-terminal sorting domain-containing protein [Flavobacterium cucumis]